MSDKNRSLIRIRDDLAFSYSAIMTYTTSSRQAIETINRQNWKLIGEITSLAELKFSGPMPHLSGRTKRAILPSAAKDHKRIQFVKPLVSLSCSGQLSCTKQLAGMRRKKPCDRVLVRNDRPTNCVELYVAKFCDAKSFVSGIMYNAP